MTGLAEPPLLFYIRPDIQVSRLQEPLRQDVAPWRDQPVIRGYRDLRVDQRMIENASFHTS